MMRRAKYPVNLTDDEKTQLIKISKKRTEALRTVFRAKMILMANNGISYQEIAKEFKVTNNVITNCTARWHHRSNEPVLTRLQDLPRSGKPSKITEEQICKIIALACEQPKNDGYPMTHWTHRELARAVVKQGIVPHISFTHLGRLLKKRFKTSSKPILA